MENILTLLNEERSKISVNIKRLMSLNDISEAELARRTGIPQTTINRLLSKGFDAKTNTLMPIASLFNVTVSHLIGEIPLELDNINYNLMTTNRDAWSSIPIIPWEQILGWRFLQEKVLVNQYQFIVTEKPVSKVSFAVYTRPFMAPLFREGSILIIDPKRELQDGVYVLVSFSMQEPTIRIVLFDGAALYLRHPLRLNEPLAEMDNTILVHGTIIECRTNI